MERSFDEILEKHASDSSARIQEYRESVATLLPQVEGAEKTPDDCRISIQIPVYFKERNIMKTLLFYAQQKFTEKLPFEIILNINGPSAEDIEKSDALKQARDAARQYLHLNICIIKQPILQKDFKIGCIRGCSAVLSLMRALQNPTVDLDKMIVVTNDADLWGLSPGYLENIYKFLEQNRDVHATGTFVDYPSEQVSTNHLGIAVQRCEEMLEIMDRTHFHHIILRSGSSAYRMLSLLEAGTFPKARKGESGQIVRNIKKKHGTLAIKLVPKHLATLTTSARRHATAVYSGTNITNRYVDFGTEKDLALVYHEPINREAARDTVVISSDSNFTERLQEEFSVLYKKRIHAKKREYAMANEASVEESEIDPDILEGLKREVQRDFQKIAPFLGIKIGFPDSNTLQIISIEVLQENLRKKYSVFD